MKYVLLSLAVVAAAVFGTYEYFRPAARHSVPPDLYEAARVPGYEAVRFWGDVAAPAFNASLETKDRQIAADAKARPEAVIGLTQANFLAISGGGDQGAFAAGLLSGWSRLGTRPTFEAVTGVSAGALAARSSGRPTTTSCGSSSRTSAPGASTAVAGRSA